MLKARCLKNTIKVAGVMNESLYEEVVRIADAAGSEHALTGCEVVISSNLNEFIEEWNNAI